MKSFLLKVPRQFFATYLATRHISFLLSLESLVPLRKLEMSHSSRLSLITGNAES
jgi:hypothetical protein